MNKKTTAFGGGVRVCPGGELGKLQIAFFLHHLVLSYRFVSLALITLSLSLVN